MDLQIQMPIEFTGIAQVLQLEAQLLGDYSIKGVNGRHLQVALASTSNHTKWAKQQIERLELVEGIDYEIVFSQEGNNSFGGKPEQTYIFTISAAKLIAGRSNTKNGLMVMKYFLHMETIAQKAMRGEPVPQVIKPQLTASEEAMRQFVSKCEMAIPMMRDLLGYGQGALRKTAIEIGLKVEKDTLEKVLPNQLKYDPEAGIAIEKDLTKGTHAVMKKLGTEGWNASTIAESFGRKITPTDVNKALIELGLQVPMNANTLRNGYTPTPKAEDLCNAEPRAGGKYKGFKAIRSWMYLEIQDKLDPILLSMSKLK